MLGARGAGCFGCRVGAIAVGDVVWVAPALLAEVLVDALIVGTVSKRMGLTERRDWTATVLRRTWVPATVMIVTPVDRRLGPAAGRSGGAVDRTRGALALQLARRIPSPDTLLLSR